ncbi:MAG: carboxylesterase family protein [Bryobacteraceae bacterium]|jgi:para-nitrobenzyl esterase
MIRIQSMILFAAMASTLAAATVDEVRVESGALKGSIAAGVVAFKGIPYAAAPTGRNRWRAPQPVTAWKGVRSATAYGSDCMQLPFPGDAAPLGVKPDEDCLYLNVWAPVQRPSGKLPVMVWIYGGGFVNGGSSPAVYDGTHFAESGVVFVSFNYRVGRFGFFAHPALTKEDPNGLLGNYCFLDQIAALQWVRKNVAKFGGDPGNVTLFGESAGGMSVLTMMTTPLARGLFHKAIVESGGGRAGIGPMRRVTESGPNLPSGEAVGIAFAQKAGIQGEDAGALAALRALPAERVCDRLNMASMGNPTYAGPMIDGKIVAESSEAALLAGHALKIPVMVGANSSDIGFSFAKSLDELFAPFGANKEKAQAVYDPEKSGEFRKAGMLVAADRMMIEPARFVARTIAATGQRAYEYRFSYVAESMRKTWKGAPHATEIPFVFDTVAARYGKDLAPADEATAKAALAYWVGFAKTGNPDGEGRPHWPQYDAQEDQLMNFTKDGPVAEHDAWKARLDLTEASAQGK